MTANLSHGGPAVYRSDGPETELVVATVDGIVLLERDGAGAPWRGVRRALEGKHVSALVREPSCGALFAGTHGQGLYASEDNGQTWDLRVRGLVSEHVYSMNVAQAGGEVRLYAGTEPANLHVSTDLGQTWRVLPAIRFAPSVGNWKFPAPPHQAHLKNIGFDPCNAGTIYASIEVGALLKSIDAGVTWRELPVPYEDVHRVVIHERAPEHVYIATGKGIYHSLDGGERWEQLTDQSARVGYPDALIVHPDQPELMFTAGAVVWPREWPNRGNADARIMRSRDWGRTWEVVDKGLPEHLHGNIEAMALSAWPGGFALYAGTTDGEVFCSEDGGESWAAIASGLPAVSKTSHYQTLDRLKQGRAGEAADGIRV